MLQQIIKTLQQKNYHIYTNPFELNIVGIRAKAARQNCFDDTLHVFYKREDGQWIIHSFAATTDPGTYWLKNLMNKNGTAILKPGQYKNSHRVGAHRNKYQALVQQNPVTVYRDANQNEKVDYSEANQQTGLFGINIHRASLMGTTTYVDKYSAGCQVFANAGDFSLFMELAKRHKGLYGNGFTYTLLSQ